MNKKIVIGISLIISCLMLMQTSSILATKPVKTEVTFNFVSIAYDFDFPQISKGTNRYYTGAIDGQVGGDIAGIYDGSFDYMTHFSSLDLDEPVWAKHDIEITIDANIGVYFGEITIKANSDIVYPNDGSGVLWFAKKGSWRIIEGTGDFVNLRGRGELEWAGFVFTGILSGLPT